MSNNINKLNTLGTWIKDYENYRRKSLSDTASTDTLGTVFYEKASKLVQDILFVSTSRQKLSLGKEISSLEKFKATPVKDLPQEALDAVNRIRTIVTLAMSSKQDSSSGSFLDKVHIMETILQEEQNISLSPSVIRQRNTEFQQFLQEKVDMKGNHQATLSLTPHTDLLAPTDKDLKSEHPEPSTQKEFSPSYSCPKQFDKDYISSPRSQAYTHHFPDQKELCCTSSEDGVRLMEFAKDFSKKITKDLSQALEDKFSRTLLLTLSQHSCNMLVAPYMQWIAELGSEYNFHSKISRADFDISPVYEDKSLTNDEEPKCISNAFKIAITAQVDTRFNLPQKNTQFTPQEINKIRDDLHIGSAVTGTIKAEYEMHMNADGSLETKNVHASYEISLNKEQAL